MKVGDLLVSRLNGMVMQGTLGEELKLDYRSTNSQNQLWQKKKATNFYDYYILSKHQRGYVNIIRNDDDDGETSYTIGLSGGRSRPNEAFWHFNLVNCWDDADVAMPRIQEEL